MKTFYKGSLNPINIWQKSIDFPFWNSIIAGNEFVIDTHENRAMKYNQIDAQETLRSKGESCLTCHGTKVAYYMGMNGVPGYPARFRTIGQTQRISSGNFRNWQKPPVEFIEIPAGTKVSTMVDNLDSRLPHQVKSIVIFPDGRIYASYDCPGATATGNSPDPAKRIEARNHIWAAFEALAFDGLDPVVNKPSMDAGMLCNMCHDPHSGSLRIIQKALIWAISRKGINPYSYSGAQIRDFAMASRQDKIVAVCGQCHVEYVGGYSAIDHIDRHYFPWGKPNEVEADYASQFNSNQDFRHGEGTNPWQTENPGRDGFYPEGSLFPIHQPLIKSQHPEAEVFWNSRMYTRGGATCTDCHTARVMGTKGPYTSHWFASPIKWIQSEGIAPCAQCHSGHHCMMRGGCRMRGGHGMHHNFAPPMTVSGLLSNIKAIQDLFFLEQEKAQAALVNSLKYINSHPESSAAIENHKRAHFRWEYYAQAENSMGFHNWDETIPAMRDALNLAGVSVSWPLPPIRLSVTAGSGSSITLSWYSQSSNEQGYVIERRDATGEEFKAVGLVAASWTGNVSRGSLGMVTWADTHVEAHRTYSYRVAAFNDKGTSSYTLSVTAEIH